MAQPLNHKEEKFKDILDNLKVQVDHESIWESVDSALQKEPKKRRRFIWIWWLIGLVSFTSLGLFLTVSNSKQTNALANNNIKQSTDKIEESISNKEKTSDQQIIGMNEEESLIEEKIKSGQKSTTIFNNKKSNLTEPNLFLKTVLAHENQIEFQENLLAENISRQVTPVDLPEINFLEMSQLASIQPKSMLMDRQINLIPGIEVQEKEYKPLLQYFSFGIGTVFTNQRLDRISINSEPGIVDQISRQTPMAGFSSELLYHFETRDKWRFSIGLNYNLSVLRYRDQRELASTSETEGITQINIDENGFTSVETGLVSVSTLSNIDVLWHHRMNQIDGSIEISKSILNNKHWSLFAGVNLGYNILTRHNGYFFDEQFKFVKTETVDDVPFSSNQGFLYGMNMCLEYQLGHY